MATGQNKVGEKPDEAAAVKRKLVWRMGIAGMMIVGLLGGLALFDRFSASTTLVAEAPQFTEPVPVQQKMTTQPVTPVETAEPAALAEAPAEPEESKAPAQSGAVLPDTPPPPIVAAQPSLPRPSQNQNVSRQTPTEMTRAERPAAAPSAAAKAAEPEAPAPAPAPPPPAATTPAPAPAPARLMNGYALQAGVFNDTQHAEDLLAKLTQAGVPASIEARVQVGPFKTRQEADAARKKLNALGVDSILLPPGKSRR